MSLFKKAKKLVKKTVKNTVKAASDVVNNPYTNPLGAMGVKALTTVGNAALSNPLAAINPITYYSGGKKLMEGAAGVSGLGGILGSGNSGGSSGSSNVNNSSIENFFNSDEYKKYKQNYLDSLGGATTIADTAGRQATDTLNAIKHGAGGQKLSAAQELEAKRKLEVDKGVALGEQQINRAGGALNALMQEGSILSGANIAQTQLAIANQKPQQGLLTQFLGGII